MAARKLQMEIDKALKKVAEGVDEFKAMVEKLHQAATPAQREKIEAELKRDIKKLQRMRDQIKTWIGSSEIKDKRALLENRRLIETQMELFKAIEKELKTKAFSKEGLGLPTKVDPEEEKKEQCAEWIRDTVDRFNQQIDMCEAQQESILASAGKRGKKAGGSNELLDRLKHQADVCRQHIRNLEIALRMLENGLLEADLIDELRDNIDYFLEQGSEAITDGTEIEDYLDIYDELGLDEEDELFAGPPMPTTAPSGPSSSVPPTPAKPVVTGPPPTISASLPPSATAAAALSPKMGAGRTASISSTTSASDSATPASGAPPSTPGHPPSVSVPPSVTPSAAAAAAASSASQNSAPPLPPPKLTAWNQKVKEGTAAPSRTGSLNGPASVDHHDESLAPSSTAPSVSSATATPKASLGLAAGLSTAESSVHSTPMSSPTPSRPSTKQPPLPPLSAASSSSKPTSSSTGTVSSSRASSMSPSPATRSTLATSGRAPSVPAPVYELSPAPRSNTVPSSDVTSTMSSSTASLDDHAPPSTSNDDQVSSITTEFGSSKLSLSGAGAADSVLVNGVFPTPPPPPPHALAYKPKPVQPLKPIRQVSKDPACPEALRDLMAIFEAVQHTARGAYVNGVPSSTAAAGSPGAAAPAAEASSTPATPTPKTEPGALGLMADPSASASTYPPSAAATDLLGILDATWMWAPSPLDAERHSPYTPQDPTPVPHYYPGMPPPVVDDPRLFEQLDLDTLFYVFYYRQGTLAQYLAARELKRQSWRFHKRYQTWFQRHEEPREITAEYEAGAYIYFDWEVGWCQRKKTEFKFEYRYLEDAELD
ncbi:Not1 N-terminal domain, CCR4-Not complex component-domain-containing protein, partial [Catenaria anguillulae PL171]